MAICDNWLLINIQDIVIIGIYLPIYNYWLKNIVWMNESKPQLVVHNATKIENNVSVYIAKGSSKNHITHSGGGGTSNWTVRPRPGNKCNVPR